MYSQYRKGKIFLTSQKIPHYSFIFHYHAVFKPIHTFPKLFPPTPTFYAPCLLYRYGDSGVGIRAHHSGPRSPWEEEDYYQEENHDQHLFLSYHRHHHQGAQQQVFLFLYETIL